MKRVITICLFVGILSVTVFGAAAPPLTDELADAMQDRDYARTVDIIDRLLAANGRPGDYLLFLRGRALHFAGNDVEAIDTFKRFEITYPESQWSRHVRFAMAVSLTRIGDFRQAEEIYRAEAEFLLSEDRKQEVADIYIASANAVFEPSDTQQKPDYARALEFYRQALEVGTKPERTPRIELRVARCLQEMKKYDEAVKTLAATLKRWSEDPLSVEVRFRLGECYLSLNQHVQARRTWQDLLAEAAPAGDWDQEQRELRAKAAFRLASTYRLPAAPNAESLSLGISSLESFVSSWSDHDLVDDAYLLMARSYESARRFEDAEAVLKTFLADERYRERELFPEAHFLLGRYQQLQKKFDVALATWRDYLGAHPAHGRWSDAQRLIIDTEYLQAEEARNSEQYDEARKAYLAFLAKFPLDQRAAQTMFLLGRMNYDQEQWDEAIKDWRHLVTKYPKSEVASRAQMMIASTIEEKLDDPEDSLEEYKKLTWGSQQQPAKHRIKRLTAKHVVVRTKHVFRSSQRPAVTLTSRNVEKVKVRVYAIDLETYFRKMHLATGVESLDVSLIDPDHTFEFDIPEYTRYRQTEYDIPLDDGQNQLADSGVYVVTVSGETLEATTMVLQSDLDVVVKGSRHEVFVYAQNMRNSEPWSGVRLLVSDGNRILGEGTTGDDGVFQQEYAELENSGDVRVFAAIEGNTASNLIELHGLQPAQGLTPRGYIYTDRAAYRPGQLVNVRALVRRVAGDVFKIDAGKQFELKVIDPRNRTVWQQDVKLSDWGTAHSRFLLPDATPQGTYRITLTDDEKQQHEGGFIVQSFQLQNVMLSVDSERDVYYRGERIQGAITASYIYGGTLADKTIRYQLGNGRSYTAKTNAQGKVEFDLETREFQESQLLPLRVDLPDLNLTVVRQFVLSSTGYLIAIDTPRPCYLSGEAFPVDLKTVDANGEPVARGLTLRVFQQTVVRGRTAEVPIETHSLKTGEDGHGQVKLQLSKGATYVLRAEGTDRFGNSISGDSSVRVSDQDDTVRLRILADKLTYHVGENAKVRLHWREKSARALVTYQGARVLGYQIVQLTTGENTVSIPLAGEHSPNFELHVAVMTDDVEPTAEGHRVRFHEASSEFFVQRELSVEIETQLDDRRHVRPGETIKVRVTTRDAQGNPTAAELSLAMVQKALIERFGDGAGSINQFFQASVRRSAVRTSASIRFKYQPATVRINDLLLAERERLREEVEERAAREEVSDISLGIDESRRDFDRDALVDGVAAAQNGGAVDLSWRQARSPMTRAAPGEMQLENEFAESAQQDQNAHWSGHAQQQVAGALIQNKSNQAMVQFDDRGEADLKSRLSALAPDSTIVALYDNGIVNHVALGDADWRTVADRLKAHKAVLIAGDVSHETGYWNPIVVTDEKGVAEVEITVPDLSTAWKLSARAITKETTVGDATHELVARKELFGHLKLPLAFTDGDRVRVPATIHNASIKQGELTATLRVDIGGRVTEFVQGVDLNGPADREIVFDLELKRPEDQARETIVQAEFELIVAGGGHQDRFARSVPILSRQIPIYASASGTSSGDATAWTELPKDLPIQARSLQIVVGPSVQQSLLDILFDTGQSLFAAANLPQAPATDSSVSDLMAAVALQKLLAESREADQPHARALDVRIRSVVGQLVSSQLDDGGWGWAGNRNQSDRNVSARTVWALSLAKAAGYEIPGETNDSAWSYLRGQLSQSANTDYESKAVLLQALVAAGQSDFALANRLHRNRPSLSTSALLHLAIALNQMKRPSLAADVLRLVEERNFDDLAPRRKSLQSSLPWSHSAIELRALYAIALQGAQPRSAIVKRVVDRLLSDRHGSRWTPDKATGPATMAICQWLETTKLEGRRYSLSVQVNGTFVKEMTFDRHSQTQTIEVPLELIKNGRKQNIKFLMSGRGQFTYQCVMRGFVDASQLKAKTSDWRVTRIYEQAQLERDGKPIPRGFDVLRGGYRSFHNALTQLPVGRRGNIHLTIRRAGVNNDTPVEHLEYLIVTEPLPAGVAVVENSISGSFDHYEISPGAITFYISNRIRWSDIRFSVHGYLEGDYRVMPTIVRDAYRPDQIAVAKSRELAVLPVGSESKDEYRMTPRELFELGRIAYEKQQMPDAIKYLEDLSANWNLRSEIEKQTTNMLLDAFLVDGPSRNVVHYFEVVKEKYPEMEVPHAKILKIGRAYHSMGEFERCYLIFRATVESSFMADSRVAGFLEKQDEQLRSVEFMNDLLKEYPPEPYAAAAMFDLAQQVYTISDKASQNKQMREQKITRIDLIRRSGVMLNTFLTSYPNDPAADQAAFSLANVLLDLEQYEEAIEACRRFAERYPGSDDVDAFWYTIGYCHFAMGQHPQALDVCRKVVEMKRRDAKTGRMLPSSNRDRAIYILGQIYHSLGKAAEAIQEYTRVKDLFSDAQEAINYFTRKDISLPEVTRVVPGRPVEVELKFRNVSDCVVQVYRIDLMKFGILQRNLADITSINLAGIKPLHEVQLELGDGKDYRDRTRPVAMPLAKEGAYLVVCRGEDLHTSGLVLVSGLRVDVQEEAASGRVRATVRELASGEFVSSVHVKVIGSNNEAFTSGETDLRGVFVADGINGETTAIAQLDGNRYAFFRGTTFLGPRPERATQQQAETQPNDQELNQRGYGERSKSLLLEGLKGRNSVIQLDNIKRQQRLFYNEDAGVRVEAVK